MKRTSMLLLSIVLSSLMNAAQAASGDESQEESQTFEYGGLCTQLTQLQQREILALLHSAHAENFQSFCRPEGIYTCEDFNSLVMGSGSLESNGLLGCRFEPHN